MILQHHDGTCHCGQCQEEKEERINRTVKLIQIISAAVFLVLGMLFENNEVIGQYSVIFFVVSYLIVGIEVVFSAFKNLFKGELFDESFLMTLATICAFFVAEYDEAVIVMLLYQIGEFIEDLAVDNSHKSVEKLLTMKEVSVHKLHQNEFIDSNIMDIRIGDLIQVKPGERIPLDGIIKKGSCNIDSSPLTGESIPIYKKEGEQVLSGSINLDSIIEVEVTTTYDNSTVNKILEYIEKATVSKTKSEKFVTRFAKIYTPIVCGAAVLVVLIPTLFLNATLKSSLYKDCLFLVVSCPCAIVISVPLAYFIGIGVSSKKGVLMKGSNYLEMIDKMDTVLFDKTGTLTKGQLIVKDIKLKDNNYISKIAKIESLSNHPIAKAIASLSHIDYDVKDFKEISGLGVSAIIDNELIEINNRKPKEIKKISKQGTTVFVYVDNIYIGYILITDSLKDDTLFALSSLNSQGIKTVMVSGDSKENAEGIAKELGINDVHSGLLPTDKVDVLDSYQSGSKGKVGYVGDGINDAPVIAKSDIGFSMGKLGSDVAVDVSDVVIMNDSLKSILNAKEISKKTVRIVYENIIMVILIKAIAMIWGLFGELPMWIAILSDVGVCLLAILNCLRLFRLAKK